MIDFKSGESCFFLHISNELDGFFSYDQQSHAESEISLARPSPKPTVCIEIREDEEPEGETCLANPSCEAMIGVEGKEFTHQVYLPTFH